MASSNEKDARDTIFISSRKSQLALVQTNMVKEMLEEKNPSINFEIGVSDTIGDQVLDQHLSDLGNSTESGLFTKSLEVYDAICLRFDAS